MSTLLSLLKNKILNAANWEKIGSSPGSFTLGNDINGNLTIAIGTTLALYHAVALKAAYQPPMTDVAISCTVRSTPWLDAVSAQWGGGLAARIETGLDATISGPRRTAANDFRLQCTDVDDGAGVNIGAQTVAIHAGTTPGLDYDLTLTIANLAVAATAKLSGTGDTPMSGSWTLARNTGAGQVGIMLGQGLPAGVLVTVSQFDVT